MYQQSLERLRIILQNLREKCPWDKEQTLESLAPQTLEEIYELLEAIKENDFDSLKEELGDLQLHILFYALIAEEKGAFSFEQVLQAISDKLIKRHPHVYQFTSVNDANQVKENWESIKLKEGKKSLFSGIPQSMPALIKAIRLQTKAKNVGFDWPNIIDVKAKIEEEWKELNEAIERNNHHDIEEEFGDLLFSMVNYSRFLDVDAESALAACNKKFMRRFAFIEKYADKHDLSISDMDLELMDALWNEAKQNGL